MAPSAHGARTALSGHEARDIGLPRPLSGGIGLLVTGYAITFAGASAAGGSFAVTVFCQPHGLRVEVRDEGADSQSAVRAQAEMTEDGRGLEIVHLIADRWGQSGTRSGRTVFFELRWPPPTPLPATTPLGANTATRKTNDELRRAGEQHD